MAKVGIIGAGASGIIAALKLSEKHEVILFDSNDKCGKKLLLTGNGHCNYWNSDIVPDNYNTDNKELLNHILTKDNIDQTYNFLYSLGIYPRNKNGYYYPYSNQAFSVREIFERELSKKSHIQRLYNFKVSEVLKKDNGYEIISDNKKVFVDKLIVSTGSKAFPKTGSNGFGYDLANFFQIKVNPVLPALVGLVSLDKCLKDLNGIRMEAIVTLEIDGTDIAKEEGEVQFTDYGLSGICIFNFSALASKALYNNQKVKVRINLLPNLNNFDEFKDYLIKQNKPVSECLESVLIYKLGNVILKRSGISKTAYFKSLSEVDIASLKNNLTNFTFEISQTNNFERCQVCTGGVSLNEIDETFKILKHDNLYFIGEVLDVDGKCGGFNLGFAFISGYICAYNINLKH